MMQPPPPAPPAPPPPPEIVQALVQAPANVAPVAVDVGTSFPITVPRNAAQVQGMRARAEEIRNQIERAQDQRQELSEALRGGETPPEGRPGIEQQLRVVDARIMQLEQDLTTTNRMLTAATPEALAESLQQERDREARQADDDEGEMFLAGGGTGVLLTLVVLTVRRFWRRRRDRGRPSTAVAAAGGEDPRYERLAQAVDAIAVEVERIGEGQRFVTQLLADQRPLVGARVEDTRR